MRQLQFQDLVVPGRQRKRKYDPPIGWTQVSVMCGDKPKKLWRCGQLQRDLHGKVRRCSFIGRKCQTHGNHHHVYNIDPDNDPFLPDAAKEVNQMSTAEFSAGLSEIVARFLGETHLSVSVGSSEAMRRFCVDLMTLTIQQKAVHPGIDFRPDLITPVFNGRKLTQDIIKLGNKSFDYLEEKLRPFKFVNIMIDAATVINMRIVHVTLSNPFSRMAPIPFRATKKEGSEWRIESYAEEVLTVLSELMSRHTLIPVAICHDRLASQSTAIRKVLSDLQKSDDPNAQLIADVPCLNHLLNNAFAASLADTTVRPMVQGIEDLTKVIRTRDAVNFIGRRCPIPPKTRWIYMADTIHFIVSHQRKIEAYLKQLYAMEHNGEDIVIPDDMKHYEESTSLPTYIFDLHLIINPLKQASLALECEQSRLGDVISIIRVMQQSWQDLLRRKVPRSSTTEHFMHTLLANVFARLRTYLPEETWAAWAMTREGRVHLRSKVAQTLLFGQDICDYPDEQFAENDAAVSMKKRINDSVRLLSLDEAVVDHPDDSEFDGQEVLASDEDEYHQFVEAVLAPEPDCNDCENLMPPPPSSCPNFTEEVMEETTLNKRFKDALCCEIEKSIEQILDFDITYEAYEKVRPVVIRYFRALYPDVSPEAAQSSLDQWLYAQEFPRNEFFHTSEIEMWLHLSKYQCMEQFSDIALRLICIGTSESDVERIISVHRFIVHDRMTNLSPEVLLARLRIKARSVTESILAKQGK